MNQTDSSEVPFVERQFLLADKEEPILTFRVWKPRPMEGDYPNCRYEFRQGSTVIQEGEVSGVDPLDSLIMCLAQAGTKIAGMNEAMFDGKLRWEGSPEGGMGLGLPTLEMILGSKIGE